MVTVFDLNVKLPKSEILQQLLTSTDLAIDNPVLVDSIINELDNREISIKFSCSVDSDTNEMMGLGVMAVDDNLIIRDSGLVLSQGYVVKPNE